MGSGSTVMILHPDRDSADALANTLRGTDPGLSFVTYHDGRSAVDHLRREPVDLVIADLRVPWFDPAELVAHMAAGPVKRACLFLSESAEADLIHRDHLAGMPLLQAPYSPIQIIDRVRQLLPADASGAGRA